MSEKTYNGWTNYETWACALWLDNDQGMQEMVNDMTRQACRGKLEKGDAVGELVHTLKELIEDSEFGCPDLGSTLYADLLNAALSSINYYEIAKHYVDDSGRFNEESEVA